MAIDKAKLADKIMSADLQWVSSGLWLTDDESMMIAAALRAPEATLADRIRASQPRWKSRLDAFRALASAVTSKLD